VQPLELSRLNGTITWLEDEARQSKASLNRLQGQYEQLVGFMRDVADQLRILQDGIATLRSQTGYVAAMDEALKSVQGAVAQCRDSLADLAISTDRARKTDLAEVDRLRTLLAEAWRRIEALRHDLDPLSGRLQHLSEAQQRIVESLQAAQSAHDALRGEVAQLGQKIQISAEREKRVDDRFGDLQLQLDALARHDEALTDQLRILSDRLLQTEERMAAVLAEEEARRSFEEQLHLTRVALTRLEKQTHELDVRSVEHKQLLDETHRLAKQVDDRRAALAGRVDEQAATIQRVRDELAELLADYEALEEQHRVRLVAELQQQIRDVRARVAKARGK
jgi:chromosome segregation ATPase